MTYQPPARPDPWADRIAGIAALRGMLGESTIKETAKIDTATRVLMPLWQTLSIAVSFVVILVSGWVLVDGWVGAFEIAIQPGMYLITLVTVGTMVGGVSYGAKKALDNAKTAVRWAITLSIILFLVVALLSAALEFKRVFKFLSFVEIVVSAGFFIGALLLLWHQLLNVVDPYWRTSPAERELLAMWRAQPEAQAIQRKRIRYRHGNRHQKILVGADEEDEPAYIEHELLDFLEKARVIGLSRSAWGKVTHILPSTGAKVTKPKYNQLMAILIADGYVIQGGDGRAAQWAPGWDAETVYEKECTEFENEWADVLEQNGPKLVKSAEDD